MIVDMLHPKAAISKNVNSVYTYLENGRMSDKDLKQPEMGNLELSMLEALQSIMLIEFKK